MSMLLTNLLVPPPKNCIIKYFELNNDDVAKKKIITVTVVLKNKLIAFNAYIRREYRLKIYDLS